MRADRPDRRIHFGGDCYPEQWPEEVWTEDTRLMGEAGVTMVTAGVFAWAKVEPRLGDWEFGWFDRVMDNLAQAGLRVCLATMTASPPPWLTRLHPEVLPETEDGRRKWPGGRQHYCPSSPVYREHAVRLVEHVAKRYAQHPALEVWHVGNEYGCHVRQCKCDVSAADFRRWLRERYGDVEALNDAWSTGFRSQRYDSFDEVLPPRLAPTFANPGQQLDYWRFSDDALRCCYLAETEVLRRLTPDVPVTTSLMPHHKPVNAFEPARHQDVMPLDFYQDPFDQDTHQSAALGARRAAVDAAGAGSRRGQLACAEPGHPRPRDLADRRRPGAAARPVHRRRRLPLRHTARRRDAVPAALLEDGAGRRQPQGVSAVLSPTAPASPAGAAPTAHPHDRTIWSTT